MTRSLAAEIAALPKLPAAELVERYRALFGTEPPITRASWLWRRIAWRIQADAYGGLSDEAAARLHALVAEFPDAPPQRPVAGIRRAGDLVPGQVLERSYKGRTVRVTVLDGGFEHDGVTYGSLSAVAFAVTGARWNGRLWMGLTTRSRDRAP